MDPAISPPGLRFISAGVGIFDARNNIPRIWAGGRSGAVVTPHVPLSTIFGPNVLKRFKVWTDGAPS